MQINKQRYELLLNGEVAISHNRDTTSPDVKLIRKICKDLSIEGDSSLYWFDEDGLGFGPDNRINHVPHYPATWFFENENN